MPKFVYRGVVDPDKRALREAVRPAHIEYQMTLVNLVGGPLLDDAGDAVGSFLIFDADDRSEAEARVTADPYLSEGVITEWSIDLLHPLIWPTEN